MNLFSKGKKKMMVTSIYILTTFCSLSVNLYFCAALPLPSGVVSKLWLKYFMHRAKLEKFIRKETMVMCFTKLNCKWLSSSTVTDLLLCYDYLRSDLSGSGEKVDVSETSAILQLNVPHHPKVAEPIWLLLRKDVSLFDMKCFFQA